MTRKILDTDMGGGYNTTPLASLAYNATATESGTGISHNTYSDVFDKTITVPLECPIPEFVFDPTAGGTVQTELILTAREFAPYCCFTQVSWMQDLYLPMVNSTVTLSFSNCPP